MPVRSVAAAAGLLLLAGLLSGCVWPEDDFSNARRHLEEHLPARNALSPWVPVDETDGDRTGMAGVGMRENPGWAEVAEFGNGHGRRPEWAYGVVHADPDAPDRQVLSYALWFDRAGAADRYLDGRTCPAPDSGRHWLQDGRIAVQVVGVDFSGQDMEPARQMAARAVQDVMDRTGAVDACA